MIIAVLLFGLVITIHEFGHFFTAKLCGIRVNEFAVGMGPQLVSFRRGETEYSLRLLPIGGYCAMEGEQEDSDDERAFNRKPVWKRILVVAMGAVMNIVLDLAFTIPIPMGVAGVALATIIAQIASWLFGVFYINRRYDFIRIRPRRSNFRKTLFVQAMRLGIPSGIQQALFSIGIMFMQSLVNSYGSTFMAGFNGANKIDTFAFLPVQSLSNALTTYTGQNIGAGNQHRVKEGLKASVIMSVVCCLVVGVLLYPTSAFMMRMFSQNPEVIDAGVAYLHGVLPFYFLLALSFMFNSVLRGAGDMLVPMISSFISLWLARLPAAYLLAYLFEKESIYYSYAIGWALGVIISGLYYATGKWKNKSIVARTQKEELA